MRIKEKREVGTVLGRGGISQRIIQIAREIAKGTYKEAIEKAGQISVLVEAASCDEYWNEKATMGKRNECIVFERLLAGDLSIDNLICNAET